MRRAKLSLDKALQRVLAARQDPANARFYQEVANAIHCSRCGRELTDEESKQRGIGPECLTKEAEENGEFRGPE